MRSRSTRSMAVAGAHYTPHAQNIPNMAREAREATLLEARGATLPEVRDGATSPRRRRGRREKTLWKMKMHI